eukprot:6214464-Pleurochrysis_carterae.AAC.2
MEARMLCKTPKRGSIAKGATSFQKGKTAQVQKLDKMALSNLIGGDRVNGGEGATYASRS